MCLPPPPSVATSWGVDGGATTLLLGCCAPPLLQPGRGLDNLLETKLRRAPTKHSGSAVADSQQHRHVGAVVLATAPCLKQSSHVGGRGVGAVRSKLVTGRRSDALGFQ